MMKVEKRSEYAKAWGVSFEVPEKTRWLTADLRGYVFASESEEKPVPMESSQGLPLVWDHHGVGIYVGKVMMSSETPWQDMVAHVGTARYRLGNAVDEEVSRVIQYCSDTIAKNGEDNAEYFAQMIRMIGHKIASKI